MRRVAAALVASAATAGVLVAGAGAGNAAPAQPKTGLKAVGLTEDGELVRFRTGSVDRPAQPRPVTGLAVDSELVGIDYRVQDGTLYGVGDAGGVYQLTPRGAATQVSQLTVPLEGTSFGVDFNPAADRLRIISDTGQNLRHDVNPGGVTTADGTLSYPPATTAATGVTGAAYTNNDVDADTATSLFDLDTNLDQVALQAPANSGQLSATGKLGVDAATDAGFDIYTVPDDEGAAKGNRAFATLQVGDASKLFGVNVLTGAAKELGDFGDLVVTDIAVRIQQ